MNQFFDAIFANLERYIGMLSHYDIDPQKFFRNMEASADVTVE